MTNLAAPAIEEIHAWYHQQNPLVRALTLPLIDKVEQTLLTFQHALDQAHAQIATQATEHAAALRVTQDRIDQLERKVFGQSSEKRRTKTPDGQREARKRRRKELSEEHKQAQREAARLARQKKLDALRTETIVLPLDAALPDGRVLPPADSVMFEWRRGELVRLIIAREQRVLPDGQIVTAPPPPQVTERGSYGPSLHAKVVVDKCLDGLPLRRQERILERLGAPVSIAVLCALFHRSAELVKPLYLRLLALVGNAEHVGADETPQPVLDEDKVRKGWMWVFTAKGGVLYVYSPSRGGTVAERVLGTSKGTLTVDGHTGYNLVTKDDRRERGGCWSHGRRGLFEARGYNPTLVDGLLEQIGELFYIEYLAIEQRILGTPAHLELRQQRSQPIVTALYATVEAALTDDTLDPRSSLAKALKYLVNQKKPLMLFLTNPHVPIHNNLSERALRVVALLRKNALFVGHDEAGENLAMLLSMTATCLLHDVDPERWLADILIAISEPGLSVDDLLPWNWKTGRGLTAKPLFDLAPA